MKKTCFALLLVAVMIMTMLPTAFAADAEPGVSLSVEDEDTLLLAKKTYTLRDWDISISPDDYTGTATKAEAEEYPFEFEYCYELPLGVTMTINAYNPSEKDENNDSIYDISCYYIQICAWSDPDGDGVFDSRVAMDWEYGKDVDDYLLPATTAGPVEGEMPTTWFAFYDDAINPDYSAPRLIPFMGDLWAMPATIQVTSDYLTKVFGPNTIIAAAVAVAEGEDEWNPEYNTYCFLLTGQTELMPRDEAETETPEPPGTSADSFSDVPAGEWYADAVDWAVETEITNGTSDGSNGQPKTFSPAQTCTQEQILTFLYRAARGEGPAAAADMDEAVAWAKEKGIIGDDFDGSVYCTRATAVNYIWQAFDSPEIDPADFSDVDAGADYAAAVAWAVENGVTNGTNDGTNGRPKTFSPDETCTRGHIVTFLYRAYTEEA